MKEWTATVCQAYATTQPGACPSHTVIAPHIQPNTHQFHADDEGWPGGLEVQDGHPGLGPFLRDERAVGTAAEGWALLPPRAPTGGEEACASYTPCTSQLDVLGQAPSLWPSRAGPGIHYPPPGHLPATAEPTQCGQQRLGL